MSNLLKCAYVCVLQVKNPIPAPSLLGKGHGAHLHCAKRGISQNGPHVGPQIVIPVFSLHVYLLIVQSVVKLLLTKTHVGHVRPHRRETVELLSLW